MTACLQRPECYCWLDQHTKLIYGVAFAPLHYSSETVRDALKMGMYRFGRPDCLYNDNGSSECSKAFGEVADDLLRSGIRQKDISDLYRTEDGRYVILDKEEKDVVDVADTADEWNRKTRRRIFANVRNAKAKDIERFFRTIEGMLDKKALPGKCATPGTDVAKDEQERKRLASQKDKHLILSYQEFIRVVVTCMKEYEESRHGTLGMSPKERLNQDEAHGFDLHAREMDPMMIELICAERKGCVVQRGRVLLGGVWYEGEEISGAGGSISDNGIWRFDGQAVEIRYSGTDRAFCYAMVRSRETGQVEARRLHPSEKVPMLDNGAMVEALKWKNRSISTVAEAFSHIVQGFGSVLYKPQKPERPMESAEIIKEEKPKNKPLLPFRPLNPTRQDRYQWCLDMLIAGQSLNEEDSGWLHEYRKTKEYQEYAGYWTRYEAQIAGGLQ